ncbi:hypothetical protein ACFP2T_43295 [Plantactinospora solaniradicis]|uniref:Uncharacterized protein n=1 Tax=Plantactinospora solaniradicis TaxID=1723736 RepID=A0ABW1KMA6_9ACTN
MGTEVLETFKAAVLDEAVKQQMARLHAVAETLKSNPDITKERAIDILLAEAQESFGVD